VEFDIVDSDAADREDQSNRDSCGRTTNTYVSLFDFLIFTTATSVGGCFLSGKWTGLRGWIHMRCTQ
jgi:hypothetical protein